MARPLRAAVAVAALVALGAPPSRAEDAPSPLRASMQCDRAIEPGRVRCAVEAHVDGAAHSIAWADVTIVSLPEFAAALKGRVGAADATSRDPSSHKWAFGLVAKKTGQGEARARVRAVVCDVVSAAPPARCAPVVVEVHAVLAVGG
jgi:hypothetical protein